MQFTKILLSLIVSLALLSQVEALQTHSYSRNRSRNMNYLATTPDAAASTPPAAAATPPAPVSADKKDEDEAEDKLE